jgi:hypothetical protein
MDIDDSTAWASQIGKQGLFEGRIPVQNAVAQCIRCAQAGILMRIPKLKPLGTIAGKGTVDDVRNPPFIGEARRKKGTWSDEDPGMEVGRGLAKVVRDRD